jgi:S-adenosylmethionine decarboxylase proenzyme
MKGLHLTADLLGCAAAGLLIDEAELAALCRAEVAAVGLTAVAERWHRFPDGPDGPGGITGVLLLAESHLAVHTWPERAGVTLDIYVCNFSDDNSGRAEALLAALLARFAPATHQIHRLQRGLA